MVRAGAAPYTAAVDPGRRVPGNYSHNRIFSGFCCLLGSPWAVRKAVEHAGGGERYTDLAGRIRRL